MPNITFLLETDVTGTAALGTDVTGTAAHGTDVTGAGAAACARETIVGS